MSAKEHLESGNEYFRQNQYQKAIGEYNKAIEIDPNHCIAWYNMGRAYYSLKEYNKAVECYEKVAEIDPEDEKPWYFMGRDYIKLGYHTWFNRFHKIGHVQVNELELYDKAVEYFKEAFSCFSKSVKINPKNVGGWYFMGEGYFYLGNIKKEFKELKEFTEGTSNSGKSIENSYAGLEEYTNAIECFENTIEIYPEHADAWYNMGEAYFAIGQYRNAMDCFFTFQKISDESDFIALAIDRMRDANDMLGKFEKRPITKYRLPMDHVILEDIQDLINNKIREGTTIDYKARDISEIDKHIVAFANTEGGHIVFGMKEKKSIPIEIEGISRTKIEKILRSFENIDPPLNLESSLQEIEIPCSDDRIICVLFVPKHPNKRTYMSRGKVYKRIGPQKVPLLNWEEIDILRKEIEGNWWEKY